MKNVNININFKVPEKHDVEKVVLKIADFTEGLYTTVPSKAKEKAQKIKSDIPCKKEQITAAKDKVVGKATDGAKKVASTAKNSAITLSVKAKAFKEASVEAGKMLGSVVVETATLFADTASESIQLFSDTIKTIAGKKCDVCDGCLDCDYECCCEEDCSQCDRSGEDACCCKEENEEDDEEDDRTKGQLACQVPQNKSEPCYIGIARRKVYDCFKKLNREVRVAYGQIRHDIALIRERDPAASSELEVLFLYSGLHAIMAHRLANSFHKRGMTVTARAISQFTKMLTGIEIHPGATIGRGVFIDHGTGVVIGETAIVGDNCTIYQGVTLGGTGKHTGKRHPTLHDGVMVGAGAKVLGPVEIGSNSKIAAGAVVLHDIPANSTAVGIPARVVKSNNIKVDELDQIHIPDPISQELCKLGMRIAAAEKEIQKFNQQHSEVNNEAL